MSANDPKRTSDGRCRLSSPDGAIYVNSEHRWHFSIAGEKLQIMTQLRTHGRGLPEQRYFSQQAAVALVYLSIVVTFAAFSLVACVIWLLIW
jgi:hypothetical protein